jgi:hypothetical protein
MRHNPREWRRNWDRQTQVILANVGLKTFYIFAPIFVLSVIYIAFHWSETDLLNSPSACIAALSLTLSICGMHSRIKHGNIADRM